MTRVRNLFVAILAVFLIAGPAWGWRGPQPDPPYNPSPEDGARDVGIRPTLEWTRGDCYGYVRYELNVVWEGGSLCIKTKETHWRPSIAQHFPPQTDVTWWVTEITLPREQLRYTGSPYHVVVYRPKKKQATSEHWQFNTGPAPPGYGVPAYKPEAVSPPDTTEGVGMLPTLEWLGGHPDESVPVTYKVHVYSSGSRGPVRKAWFVLDSHDRGRAPTIYGGPFHWRKRTQETAWQIPMRRALPPDTDVCWYVKACTEDTVVRSQEFHFTTTTYPWIRMVSPRYARPSYTIEIHGMNFGDQPGRVRVAGRRIGSDYYGKVLSWSDDLIRVRLPDARAWRKVGWIAVRVFDADNVSSNRARTYVSYH